MELGYGLGFLRLESKITHAVSGKEHRQQMEETEFQPEVGSEGS